MIWIRSRKVSDRGLREFQPPLRVCKSLIKSNQRIGNTPSVIKPRKSRPSAPKINKIVSINIIRKFTSSPNRRTVGKDNFAQNIDTS